MTLKIIYDGASETCLDCKRFYSNDGKPAPCSRCSRKKEESEFLRGIEAGKKSLTTQELLEELKGRDDVTLYHVPERGMTILPDDMGLIKGEATILVVRGKE